MTITIEIEENLHVVAPESYDSVITQIDEAISLMNTWNSELIDAKKPIHTLKIVKEFLYQLKITDGIPMTKLRYFQDELDSLCMGMDECEFDFEIDEPGNKKEKKIATEYFKLEKLFDALYNSISVECDFGFNYEQFLETQSGVTRN